MDRCTARASIVAAVATIVIGVICPVYGQSGDVDMKIAAEDVGVGGSGPAPGRPCGFY